MQFIPRTSRTLAIGAFGLACATTVHAAGFALIEQSVSGLGTAFAGSAASADSVDTLYFNPAGMTRLRGTQAGAALHLIEPDTEFNNNGTTYLGNPLLPISGSDGGDASDLAAQPHFYLTHQLDDRTWFGLAINAPFGLTTEYKSDWVGRYHAIKSEVTTVNINPSIAYRVSDQLSFALGVSAMYFDGEFTNAVDFGLLQGLPGSADGRLKIEGNSWGWGVNLGALFEPSEDTRIGLHYRSEVKQEIEGDAKFEKVPNPPPLTLLGFTNTDATADIDLPATFSISGFHQINREWAIVGDYTWTGWSSIPELRFEFDNALPDGVTTFDWKDTSRVAIGTIYTPVGSDWSYRLGAAYDESPVRDAASRSARLPDTDRIWLTVGAGFNPTANMRIDLGYAHLFMNDAKIAKTATGEDLSRGALNGSYEGGVDILSLEAQYRF